MLLSSSGGRKGKTRRCVADLQDPPELIPQFVRKWEEGYKVVIGVQFFFIGILGEYIGSIHTQVHRRPLVVEKERINFD
jgi:hypothetical protein